MENALNASQTELDASGAVLKQARTELEANRGQIDGYRTLVATMDSQITALQAQMDLLAGGSKGMADIKYSDAGTDHAKRCDADRYC